MNLLCVNLIVRDRRRFISVVALIWQHCIDPHLTYVLAGIKPNILAYVLAGIKPNFLEGEETLP